MNLPRICLHRDVRQELELRVIRLLRELAGPGPVYDSRDERVRDVDVVCECSFRDERVLGGEVREEGEDARGDQRGVCDGEMGGADLLKG